MLSEYSDILTPKEVMDILSISKNTLYTMIRHNEIPAFRLGPRCWRFQKADLIHYLKNVVDWE